MLRTEPSKRPEGRPSLAPSILVPLALAALALGAASCRTPPDRSAEEAEALKRYWRGARERTPGRLEVAGPAAREVAVSCDRWPDGSDLRRFGQDAVRLSGARTEEEKALAVWRWVRRWTMYTDGNPPTEPSRRRRGGYVDDPLKQLDVYGAHWCDGLSRVVECVWRAMGGQAQKLFRSGHTMVDLRYRDADGIERWHVMDVSEGGFMPHSSGRRLLSADEMCTDYYNGAMFGWVHCPHLPMPEHRMELDLRRGERLERLWGGSGKAYQDNVRRDHQTVPDSERGPYATVAPGGGTWVYAPDLSGKAWREGLAAPPEGLAAEGLSPARAGKRGRATWDFRTPYIVADARVELDLVRGSSDDRVALHLSVDGGRNWTEAWSAPPETAGRQKLVAEICPKYRVTAKEPPPSAPPTPFGHYAWQVRLELRSRKPRDCRVLGLRFVTDVQQNFYALPQLAPGRNVISVRGKLDTGAALRVTYLWDDPAGPSRRNVTVLESLPASYEIVAGGKQWADVVCRAITVEALAADGGGNRSVEKEAPAEFTQPPAMPPVESTRHCWLRPDRAKLPALDELLAGTRRDAELAASLRGLIELRDARGFEAARRAAFEVTPTDRGALKGVKELALVAMYASDRGRARPELLKILEDETASPWKHDEANPAVRGGHWVSGAAMIGYMAAESGWREFVPGLLRALQSPHAGMGQRAGLLRCLGRLGDPRAREAVRERLYDRDPDVLPQAARAAGRLGDRAAVARLRELTECGYEPTELAAAEALGELGDGAIAMRMRSWLKRVGDEDYRAVAARALGRLGDRGSLAALREAAKRESFPWVRAEMERAVGRVR